MKQILPILFFFTCSSYFYSKKNIDRLPEIPVTSKQFNYLALGDSYTIGESVLPAENFPNQTVEILRKAGQKFNSPEIIAKTGWTTAELREGIKKHEVLPSYDFVTLLIGVNNQYRGGDIENYRTEFESLLKQAISYAGGKNEHVMVLSIPDWGVTPFAKGRTTEQIAKEIDAYNAANKQIAEQYVVHYLDITAWTREAVNDKSLLAPDGLHPSGKEYKRWAEQIAAFFKQTLI